MNSYKALVDLLPRSPRLMGDVLAINGDGSVTVALLGGGVLTASSTTGLTIGQRVFVQRGVVIGTAPALPGVTIDV